MQNQELHSQNSRTQSDIDRLFIPTTPRLLLYFLISFLALILLNLQQLWHYFTNDILSSPQSFGDALGTAPWAHKIGSVIYQGRLLQVIFWAFMGCGVYVIFWFFSSIYSNIHNDIVADEYLHPNAYNRASFWHSVIARKAFFALICLVLLGFLFACVRFLPLLGELCRAATQDFTWNPSVVQIVWAWVSLVVLLYVLDLLIHLTFNAWRLIYSDL